MITVINPCQKDLRRGDRVGMLIYLLLCPRSCNTSGFLEHTERDTICRFKATLPISHLFLVLGSICGVFLAYHHFVAQPSKTHTAVSHGLIPYCGVLAPLYYMHTYELSLPGVLAAIGVTTGAMGGLFSFLVYKTRIELPKYLPVAHAAAGANGIALVAYLASM